MQHLSLGKIISAPCWDIRAKNIPALLISNIFILYPGERNKLSFFPKEVHLRFSYILLVSHSRTRKLFLFIWGVGGGWWVVNGGWCPIRRFFKILLHTITIYCKFIYILVYTKGIRAEKKSYWFKNLEKLGPMCAETSRISGALNSKLDF